METQLKKTIKKHKPKPKGDQRRTESLNSCLIFKAKKKWRKGQLNEQNEEERLENEPIFKR